MHLDADDRKSWAISGGVHGLLLLIALLFVVQSDTVPLPELDIMFLEAPSEASPVENVARPVAPSRALATPVPRQRSTRAQTQSPAARQQRNTQQEARSAPASPRTKPSVTPRRPAQASQSAQTDRRQIPTAAAPSASAPPPRPRGGEAVDFTNAGKPTRTVPSAGSSPGSTLPGSDARREETLPRTSASGGGKDAPSSSGINEAGSPGELSASPRAGVALDWGSGPARSRIAGQLPAFPRDATRSAQVRARFRVKPDGTVTGISIVQKAAPAFDEAVLAALRTWRFNPVKADGASDQEATAVFTFKLR